MENNTELLRLLGMPVFKNTTELAQLMHLNPKTVNVLVMHNSRFYKKYNIKKSSGALRQICQPNTNQKAVQAWILRNILDRLTVSTHATAFIKGKCLKDNVEPHKNNRYFLCIDLQDFFDTITFRKIYQIFSTVGYSPKVSWALAKLCTCDGKLPQGAVTSPSLSNLVAFKLDRRLSGYVSRRNITYTRYSDDMSFSAQNPKVLAYVYACIGKIITSENFTIQQSKVRFFGPARNFKITGLKKNSVLPRFGVGRTKRREVRAMIYNLKNLPPMANKKYIQKIEGWLSYIKSVDEISYKSLKTYYDNTKIRLGLP